MLKLIAFTSAFLFPTFCYAETRYVSTGGTGNACTFSDPCGTLGAGVAAALVGDTVVCLSTPQSSAVNITKSLTIDRSSARAPLRDFIVPGQGNLNIPLLIDIPFNSADPLRTVRLRGLTIDGTTFLTAQGQFPGGRALDRGIDIRSAAVVHVEDCVISNMRQQGIYDHRTGGQTSLFVKDSFISGSNVGVSSSSQAVGITELDNVRLERNGYGIAAASGNNVFINRAVISGNTTAGVEADPGAQIEVSNSALTHNNIGVQAGGIVRLRENDIKFSNTAIQGATVSMGANRFSGNGTLGTAPSAASGASADVFN